MTFTAGLPDGLDGFPGNRTIWVSYSLNGNCCLELYYKARTDQATYFNLSGDFSQSALEQELQINAVSYIKNDAFHIPMETAGCANTPFDFHQSCSLKKQTDAPCIVLYSGGYIGRSHSLDGQIPSSNSCALALEAQDIPDAPHFVPEQYHITAAGETFTRTIRYCFEVD